MMMILQPTLRLVSKQFAKSVSETAAGTVAKHPKTGHGTGHGTCAPERTPTNNPLQLVGEIANPRLISDSMRSKSHY